MCLSMISLIQSELEKTTVTKQKQTAARLILEAQNTRKTECLEQLRQAEATLQKTEDGCTQQSEQRGNHEVTLSAKKSEIDTLQAVLDYSSIEKAQQTIAYTTDKLDVSKSELKKAEWKLLL